ncbi:hypothetical protein AVEN_266637-1 [Araneus ventricosus]|uniref:Uncharacterized protein n=1 Tax=Araneus ventricosus TaxID=182803 RepID=A0A4Y2CBX7_ARAVE|nr:hypothetical protein AVEN_266637-1 [Araneus ventricosus]
MSTLPQQAHHSKCLECLECSLSQFQSRPTHSKWLEGAAVTPAPPAVHLNQRAGGLEAVLTQQVTHWAMGVFRTVSPAQQAHHTQSTEQGVSHPQFQQCSTHSKWFWRLEVSKFCRPTHSKAASGAEAHPTSQQYHLTQRVWSVRLSGPKFQQASTHSKGFGMFRVSSLFQQAHLDSARLEEQSVTPASAVH